MQKDRNSLRKSIIGWIKSRVKEDVDDMAYKGLLMKYFNMFDSDKDEKLDTLEFVRLVETDLTMAEVKYLFGRYNVRQDMASYATDGLYYQY